jgi:hypothetical protein
MGIGEDPTPDLGFGVEQAVVSSAAIWG